MPDLRGRAQDVPLRGASTGALTGRWAPSVLPGSPVGKPLVYSRAASRQLPSCFRQPRFPVILESVELRYHARWCVAPVAALCMLWVRAAACPVLGAAAQGSVHAVDVYECMPCAQNTSPHTWLDVT